MWLISNADAIQELLQHADRSLGGRLKDLLERLGALRDLRARGLPKIDGRNVDVAMEVLGDSLLPVILKNWEIWAGNVQSWEELKEALRRLRLTRQHNSKVPIYYDEPEQEENEGQKLVKKLQTLLKGASVKKRDDRWVFSGLGPARAQEAAKILQSMGIEAWANRKGMLVVKGGGSFNLVEAEEPGRKPVRRVKLEKKRNEARQLKENEERPAKRAILPLLKSVIAAWRRGEIALKEEDGNIVLEMRKETHKSKVIYSSEFTNALRGALGGLSEGNVKRVGRRVILDRNAAQVLLLAEDDDFRNAVKAILEKRLRKKGKK